MIDYLGSLSEIITSTTRSIRYKIYGRHKDFHQGNDKGKKPTKFLRIVRWSKTVIKEKTPQLSISPPLNVSLSLSCELESVRCV